MILNTTLQQLTPAIDTAIKQELVNEGHVKTGNLLASINTIVVPTDDGFQLQTNMLPYGIYLDARTNFLDNAIAPLLPDIQTQITDAVALMILGSD